VKTILVYVVGFAPADDLHSIGGFDWFPAVDRAGAVARLLQRVTEGDGHSVTFVPLRIPFGVDPTEWIDGNLELIEVGRESARADSEEIECDHKWREYEKIGWVCRDCGTPMPEEEE
jgi:hypothetical protein